jgi:hypothetical protein
MPYTHTHTQLSVERVVVDNLLLGFAHAPEKEDACHIYIHTHTNSLLRELSLTIFCSASRTHLRGRMHAIYIHTHTQLSVERVVVDNLLLGFAHAPEHDWLALLVSICADPKVHLYMYIL